LEAVARALLQMLGPAQLQEMRAGRHIAPPASVLAAAIAFLVEVAWQDLQEWLQVRVRHYQ
jgi:hypothetical protein